MNKIPLAFWQDLKPLVFTEENQKFYYFEDELQLASNQLIFSEDIFLITTFINGVNTFEFISIMLEENYQIPFSSLEISTIYNQLNSYGFIENNFIKEEKQKIKSYLDSHIRPYICADSSYPSNPIELSNELDKILRNGEVSSEKEVIAIMAPHIDFRLGELTHKVYSPAFNLIKNCNPDLVVIIGTAHYKSSDYFMFTNKLYSTPLGVVETDFDIQSKISEKLNGKITYDEMAHYPEHSLEYHIVLLQHILKGKEFKILPILSGSLFNETNNKTLPNEVDEYSKQINAIKGVINESNKKVLFLASGDLAHIGRRFGDEFDASEQFDELNNEDKILINHLSKINKEAFFQEISKNNDKRRICGLSPFYAMLNLINPNSSKVLGYNLWDDTSTKTAVSFCSIAYFN